ncbi:MAG TPA: hypothetical protein VNM89_02960 [Solirubrobacterales bacterium]|nr:hypothetical protein [Solirubrobacterales bacterium]
MALAFLAFAPAANASKQAIDFFGGDGALGGQFTQPNGVAVNDTGAGPADAGDVYAIDSRCCQPPNVRSGNRIQRFGRDDNGTPADTADDTYFFISAWGADVDSASIGGSDYEICTVAAQCQTAVASGGNGTAAGNGALNFTDFFAGAIAVDQDTGNVFVTDTNNNRVNVYDGTGTFLRSFGFDVAASGPGNTGTGFEICVAADGDVCKAGVSGSNTGQIGAGQGIAVSPPDANPATATVFLADSANNRVNTYRLDGSGPASIGSAAVFRSGSGQVAPTSVAVDSRGILYASNFNGAALISDFRFPVERYDTQGVNGPIGFLAPIAEGVNEVQEVTVAATAGTFKLSFDPDGVGPQSPETTADLPYNATNNAVEQALKALPSIGQVGIRPANGGPGDATGSAPYIITFQNTLGAKDLAQLTCANGATPLSGGAGCSVATITPGQFGLVPDSRTSLAIDPDSDGGGAADTDVLYVARGGAIQQFGPLNAPGLLAPPSAEDDRHGTNGAFSGSDSIAVEPATGRLYAASFDGLAGRGVYVLDNSSPTPPTASMDSVDGITADSAELHATIDPNGPPATRYHFEYSTDGSNWLSLPEVFLGTQQDPQAVDATLEPPPIGLDPKTRYHVRLLAGRKFATPVVSNELTFTTAGSPPLAETAGAPVRSTTTAQLNGRVTPLGSATTYRFEYGLDQTYGQSTPSAPAGSGQLTQLVAEEIASLDPDTTYHYRLVAENGVGSPVPGADMTVHTRATEELPNQSDEFPGPPDSDRAWEQVSIGDSGGNPVGFTQGIADDGDAVIYGIFGGTPISSAGSAFSIYYAERPDGAHPQSGWETRLITPARELQFGPSWDQLFGRDDLASVVSSNQVDLSTPGAIWRLHPDGAPEELFRPGPLAGHSGPQSGGTTPASFFGISADGSRVVAGLKGTAIDPAFPAASSRPNFYDIGGQPQLLSLLPGEVPPACGVVAGGIFSDSFRYNASHWISADGNLVVFAADDCSSTQLYLRDIGAQQTRAIGPGNFLKQTPGAVFFSTTADLDPAKDAADGGNDVYRYDIGDTSLACLTCIYAGFSTEVAGANAFTIAVSEDGLRIYFSTSERLLPGAPADGTLAIYRLDVAGGGLSYIAPTPTGTGFGPSQPGVALTPDSSRLIFTSDRDFLNPLSEGADNGGLSQYYRYDDTDRSLLCATCPPDGSEPLTGVTGDLVSNGRSGAQPNLTALSADGQTFAFATPTPLLGSDQNTSASDPVSGIDIYEWRDGRLALVSDGLTSWSLPPLLEGISPSGRDIYFSASAQYTADAIDAGKRLYDARIGGGIDLPEPPQPCPLEVCQGTPRGAPDDPLPASTGFSGRGNIQGAAPPNRRTCPRGKRKVRRGGKVRCVKPKRGVKRANHRRRAQR